MKIQFCGAAKTVTGSCFYVDTGATKFLVDCGAFQGPYEHEELNYEDFPFNPAEIEYVFLTHAHFDHCGRLPVLVKKGFRGEIISTLPTRDLAKIILLDSAKIQKEEYQKYSVRPKKESDVKFFGFGREDVQDFATEYQSTLREPLFSEDDVLNIMQYFKVYSYGEHIDLSKDLQFRMREAGHILGSSIFEIWAVDPNAFVSEMSEFEEERLISKLMQDNVPGEPYIKGSDEPIVRQEQQVIGTKQKRKLVFSGDLGQNGQRIVKDPDMIREADYVIVESTYGNRVHKNKDETVLELLSIIKEAQKDGGNILIPSFAIERAQEVLYEMNLFYEKDLVKGTKVYLDSPMAIASTEVFRQYTSFYDEDAQWLLEKGDDPFEFEELHFIETPEESKSLIDLRGVIIVAGSGMCNGGRILHHLKNNIENPKTHVAFVGYQVEGTLGRRIVDGEKLVRIHGKEYQMNAKVHTLGGFSAHADMKDLLYWIDGFGKTPRKVFVVHGAPDIIDEYAQKIRDECGLEVYAPNMNEVVGL